jgi:SAM-dependent methyltransferase
MTDRPRLPPTVVVLPGTDLEGEWERFRIFEALHHGMAICNPMTGGDLEALVDALDPTDGERAVDLACGHGELLLRMAARSRIEGMGVDLSPWVIARAARRAGSISRPESITWCIGEARTAGTETSWDIATCLGASWVWHGFAGTVRALASRVNPGGRIAVGDLRLREGADPDRVAEEHGRVPTREEQAELLTGAGLCDIDELAPTLGGWDGYLERIAASAETWAARHPGEEAERFVAESESWRLEHERDRAFLRWTVWTARRP